MRNCQSVATCQARPANAAANATISKLFCRLEAGASRLSANAVPAIMYKKKIVI
jgi:hypothetical protein